MVDSSAGKPQLNQMVELETLHLDKIFHALSDGTRRSMLRSLADGERSISDLAAPYAMSLAGASKHVRVLEGAGLVRREIRGRTHVCRLNAARLAEAEEWLRHYERFWNRQLDALDASLKAEDAKSTKGEGHE
jgi:DNA-binding transcriptional ArsR family regulator